MSKENRSRSIFIWNMLGSLCNAASSVILLMIVNRVSGETDGGIFSIAFATAQLMLTIGNFEMRPYQSTDIKQKFKFKDYLTFRIITCIIMMISTILYIMYKGYSGQVAIVTLLLCIYKMIDSVSDVFQGLFQQRERLDMSGKTLAIRVTLSTLGFVVAMFMTKNLVVASVTAVIISILWFIVYDLLNVKMFDKIEISLNWENMIGIFKECLPLFIGSFMLMYIINSPKYAIDKYMDLQSQNAFSIIFMPASVINLFSIFVFRPLLTTLSSYWIDNKYNKFAKICKFLIGWIVILTIGASFVAYFIGIPVLNWFYHTDLNLRTELIIVLIGGGFSALSTILYYMVTVMRKQYTLLIGYIISFGISLIICPVLVKNYGMFGATLSYVVVMFILSIIFMSIMIINFIKEKRKLGAK